uniref:Uncharacterized protein n=1 Tax=Rhizophora mucronata TaxID=61149 RepID=A0A2P2IZU4_RHIMU
MEIIFCIGFNLYVCIFEEEGKLVTLLKIKGHLS